EVIGIAGVAGNGQGEFFESVSGEVPQQDASSVRIRGKDAGGLTITGRRLLGAAFVPEERLGHGAAPRMKLSENLLLSRHATDGKAFVGSGGMVKSGAIQAASQRIIEAMDV
ncbi:MAG: ABC transporter ATP-binding protein, partial [Mesorhizobium sp.]